MHVLNIQMLWFVTGSPSIFWDKQHTKIVSRISPMRCENTAILSFRLIFILPCQFISIAVKLNCLFPLLFTISRNRSELVHLDKSAYRMIVIWVCEATYTKCLCKRKVIGDCYYAMHALIFSYFTDASHLSKTHIRYTSTKKSLKIPRKYLIFCYSKA